MIADQGWWKPDLLYGNFKKWLDWQNKSGLLPTFNKFCNRIGDFRMKGLTNTFEYHVNGKSFKKSRGENGQRYSIRPKENEYI